MQGVQQVDGRGVMIGALAGPAPVAHHQLHIEEPALHPVAARLYPLHRAGAECDRCQPGDAGQAFLGAGVHRVRSPGIDLELNASQGGYRVDDGEGAVIPGQGTEGLGIAAHAG